MDVYSCLVIGSLRPEAKRTLFASPNHDIEVDIGVLYGNKHGMPLARCDVTEEVALLNRSLI
jgi:hypothetical protein